MRILSILIILLFCGSGWARNEDWDRDHAKIIATEKNKHHRHYYHCGTHRRHVEVYRETERVEVPSPFSVTVPMLPPVVVPVPMFLAPPLVPPFMPVPVPVSGRRH
jgi:hypothetical protein